MALTFGSVCSGIEAASVAWEPLGWIPAWFSEIEPFPCELLDQRLPWAMNYGDMTTLPERIRAREIEAPDLLCGGTPCQAFSVAGKRQSLADNRGNLTLIFCEIANAIEDVRNEDELPPPIIFWENVPGVLHTKDNAFGCFLGELCGALLPLEVPSRKWPSAGIVTGAKRSVAWRTLDAQFFGVPQRRKRVFVIASSRQGFNPAKVLFERPSLHGDSCESTEKRKVTTAYAESSFGTFRQTDDQAGTLKASGGVIGGGAETLIIDISHRSDVIRECGETSPTLTARMGTGGNNVPCIQEEAAVRRLTPVECERLQGFPDDWTKISYRGKDEDECPDSPRYKAIGNSWAVPVVRWLGERIQKELDNAEKKETD